MWGPLWYIKCVLPVIALQTSTHMEGRVTEVVVSPTRTENASFLFRKASVTVFHSGGVPSVAR